LFLAKAVAAAAADHFLKVGHPKAGGFCSCCSLAETVLVTCKQLSACHSQWLTHLPCLLFTPQAPGEPRACTAEAAAAATTAAACYMRVAYAAPVARPACCSPATASSEGHTLPAGAQPAVAPTAAEHRGRQCPPLPLLLHQHMSCQRLWLLAATAAMLNAASSRRVGCSRVMSTSHTSR
jgi:hypothetical protein